MTTNAVAVAVAGCAFEGDRRGREMDLEPSIGKTNRRLSAKANADAKSETPPPADGAIPRLGWRTRGENGRRTPGDLALSGSAVIASARRRSSLVLPMPTSTASDHRAQLRQTFLVSRDHLLAQHQTALAAQACAAQVRDVHERTLAETEADLAEARARLICVAQLERALLDTRTAASDAATLATRAHEDATTTIAAMAAASSSAVATATAIEDLTVSINSLAGITRANDANEPIDRAAQAAVAAVPDAARASEKLKSLVMLAHVAATQATAALLRDAAPANAQTCGELSAKAAELARRAAEAVHEANRSRAAATAALLDHPPSRGASPAQPAILQQAIQHVGRLARDRRFGSADRAVSPATHGFAELHVAELHRLAIARTVAEQKLTAARASLDALRARQQVLQTRADTAAAEAGALSSLAADGKQTAAALARTAKSAAEARTQSAAIDRAVERAHAAAHALTLSLLPALEAIDLLAAQVARSQGKNEMISPLVVSRTVETQTSATKALQLATETWQKCVAALVASRHARATANDAANATAIVIRRFGANAPRSSRVRSASTSCVQLAKQLDRGTYSAFSVLNAHATTAVAIANRQRRAATGIDAAIIDATDHFDRATLQAETSTAALAAAETAVSG